MMAKRTRSRGVDREEMPIEAPVEDGENRATLGKRFLKRPSKFATTFSGTSFTDAGVGRYGPK